MLVLNAGVLVVAAILRTNYDASFAFSENLGLVTTVDAAQLLAAGALGLLAFRWFWSEREAAAEPAEAAGIFLWGLTGLGLIAFAIDDFFGLHERLSDWISEHIGVLPLLTNNADDVITLGYGAACLIVLAMFRHELFASRASSALLAAAVLPAALMLLTDAYGHGPFKWLEEPLQTLAVAMLLLAHLVREEEVRPLHRWSHAPRPLAAPRGRPPPPPVVAARLPRVGGRRRGRVRGRGDQGGPAGGARGPRPRADRAVGRPPRRCARGVPRLAPGPGSGARC